MESQNQVVQTPVPKRRKNNPNPQHGITALVRYGKGAALQLIRLSRGAESEHVKLAATIEVLNRVYGKSIQPIVIAGQSSSTLDLTLLTREQRDALATLLRAATQRLEPASLPGGGADTGEDETVIDGDFQPVDAGPSQPDQD